MTITDTHTHLYSEEFDQDETIQRALSKGISDFIPAIDSSYTQAMYDLEKNYPEHVFLMMGLHPTHEAAHAKNARYQLTTFFVR
jgi:TatD DNase family protein